MKTTIPCMVPDSGVCMRITALRSLLCDTHKRLRSVRLSILIPCLLVPRRAVRGNLGRHMEVHYSGSTLNPDRLEVLP